MPSQTSSHPSTSDPSWAQYSHTDQPAPLADSNQAPHNNNTQPGVHPTSYPGHGGRIANNSKSVPTIAQHPSPDQSDSLYPPNAASPTFSFDDYLTPEFSSSDNHYSEQSNRTTPGLEDSWQDSYRDNYSLPQDPHPFGPGTDDSFLLGTAHHEHGTNGAHLGGLSHALMTPEMSTASMTPERTLPPNLTSNVKAEPIDMFTISPPLDRARPRMNPGMSTQPSGPDSPSENGGQEQARPQVVSPVVMISTYNRGDSPARSHVPLSRSNSKRSQSSRLGQQALISNELDDQVQNSRLKPPNNAEHEQWDDDDDDDDEVQGNNGRRVGVAPTQRKDDFVPSINDLERQRELDEKSADVVHWLATSVPGSPTGSDDDGSRKYRNRKNRIRSRSTGTRVDAMGLQIFDDSHIPGPGALIEVDSNYYYSDGESDVQSVHEIDSEVPESPPADVKPDAPDSQDSYFPSVDDDIAPDELEPLPRQFYRKQLWQDPLRGLPISDERGQPPTANAAMAFYERQSQKFETASRAATWGTRRRLSDGDIGSILDGTSVTRHLSLKDTLANRARARGSSIINSVQKVLPGRSSSFMRKHSRQNSRQESPEERTEIVQSPGSEEPNKHRESIGSNRPSPLHRISSRGKSKPPKSPPVSATGAFMAMTGHLAAVGGNSVNVASEQEPPTKSPLLGALKRVRSKSEVNKSPKANQGLASLFTKHIGPPMPVLASPLQVREPSPKVPTAFDEDMDEDGLDEETGITMDLPVQTHNIIPNLDGFKTHARQLNPRLEPYLIERIGHDQLKRFKKLVKSKVDHTRAVQTKKCTSGTQCLSQGGKATILPPRTGGKDSSNNFAQFKIAGGGESDNEEAGFVEGVVTPALFPHGIPLPPTTHLPAEFECPLCFQVKKFQKPSDWTKHVHEDVQPFSCTFPNCPEPKSFKRKADWVRHENERHRHLEWWKCSVQECAHVCYRKDNFVQHLVREHKMTEPKSKGSKSGTSRARASSRAAHPGQNQSDFWHLVEACRAETTQSPRGEPCKFCGNVCSTWKKLSVHVGKHMEQIAMPVLELAERQKVSAETIISPIEAPPTNFVNTALDNNTLAPEPFVRSPYATSAHSYPNSSAGHSPAITQANPAMMTTNLASGFYNPGTVQPNMQNMALPASQLSAGPNMAAQYPYEPYDHIDSSSYINTSQQAGYHSMPMTQNMAHQYPGPQIPRSQPMEQHYDPVSGLHTMQGTAYEHQAPHSPVQYYANNTQAETSYVSGYGHEMGHTHEGMGGTQSGHVSHGHTPGSTGHAETNMGYYPSQQAGSSGPNYY